MQTVATNVFDRNMQAFGDPAKTVIINQGGTSSSKTYSIIQVLIKLAESAKKPILISIVSESLPHLKRGCIRDFTAIMGESFRDESYNRSDKIYTFGSGATIEFFGADASSKLRGGRRDVLYINEANNVTKAAYDELQVRTRIKTFLDYNPVCEFWAHAMLTDSNVAYIHSTYLDAKSVLPPEIVAAIESRREKDPNWWRVYGLGETGNIEGLVHPNFTIVDNVPPCKQTIYGLDFGFTNDPTVLTRNSFDGDRLFSEELIYKRGMLTSDIIDAFMRAGVKKTELIVADCEDPKTIAEIRLRGYNIVKCEKGRDSVRSGIDLVNQFAQHWTKESTNCIKEQRSYYYIQDRDGHYTNVPIDANNHGMDSRRYAVAFYRRPFRINSAKVV